MKITCLECELLVNKIEKYNFFLKKTEEVYAMHRLPNGRQCSKSLKAIPKEKETNVVVNS